jgi:hypothetical protein
MRVFSLRVLLVEDPRFGSDSTLARQLLDRGHDGEHTERRARVRIDEVPGRARVVRQVWVILNLRSAYVNRDHRRPGPPGWERPRSSTNRLLGLQRARLVRVNPGVPKLADSVPQKLNESGRLQALRPYEDEFRTALVEMAA